VISNAVLQLGRLQLRSVEIYCKFSFKFTEGNAVIERRFLFYNTEKIAIWPW